MSRLVHRAVSQFTTSQEPFDPQLPPGLLGPEHPHVALVLLFFLLEVAAFGGLAYAIRFSPRLGLKSVGDAGLSKALASPSDIIFRPVSRVLLFSILTAFGIGAVAMLAIPIFGLLLPLKVAAIVSVVVTLPLAFTQAAAFVFTYRGLGGTRWVRGLLVFFVAYTVNSYLTQFDALALVAPQLGLKLSTLRLVAIVLVAASFVFQLPALLCIRGRFYITPQVNSIPSVDLEFLKRSVLFAGVPIVASHLLQHLALEFVGIRHFVPKAVTMLSTIVDVLVTAAVAIFAVDRALVSSDFDWHWIAFLAPAVPVFVASIPGLLIFYFSTSHSVELPIGVATILYALVDTTCNTGTLGVISGVLYIQYLARISRREMNNVPEAEGLTAADSFDV